jgi:hypothetical protein
MRRTLISGNLFSITLISANLIAATLILTALSLGVPSIAIAQRHGGTGGGAPVMAGAPHVAAPGAAAHPMVGAHPVANARPAARVSTASGVGAPAATIRRVGVNGGGVNQRVNVGAGLRNLPLFPSEADSVPGLGFDFPHFAAVNQNRVRPRFDRAGLGFGFGGFLLEPSVIVVEQPGESQPNVEEVPSNPARTENQNDLSDQFLPAPVAPVVSAPPREMVEYVFVRRDGSLLFAVGYLWDNGTLRYVTRDGVRHSVTRDALDMDATQQFNEQRGLSFRTPA